MARVLIIDDDSEIRNLLSEMLQEAGHEVATAAEGGEGIRLFRAQPFDLLITDLIMPGKEGLQTIRELHHDFPALKIIAISGLGSSEELNFLTLAKGFGAVRTLAKPFSVQSLLNTVNDVLNAAS